MSFNWLPFYGIAIDAVGALLLAWAHQLRRRQETESTIQCAIVIGAGLIFLGFFLQAWGFLGTQYNGDYYKALFEIAIAAVVAIILYVILLFLFNRHLFRCAGAQLQKGALLTHDSTAELNVAADFHSDIFIQWLNLEIGRNQAYHNHKEAMAWLAAAFYIPGIIAIGYFSPKLTYFYMWVWPFLLIVSLCVFILVFLNFQFRNRWVSAGRIAGLIQVLLLLQSGWNPPQAEQVIRGTDLYPLFIEQRSRSANDLRKVEYATDAAIILSTVIAVLLLILKTIPCHY